MPKIDCLLESFTGYLCEISSHHVVGNLSLLFSLELLSKNLNIHFYLHRNHFKLLLHQLFQRL